MVDSWRGVSVIGAWKAGSSRLVEPTAAHALVVAQFKAKVESASWRKCIGVLGNNYRDIGLPEALP